MKKQYCDYVGKCEHRGPRKGVGKEFLCNKPGDCDKDPKKGDK